MEPNAVFQRTKEHCLMGIHGTVRRSTDGDFIHANVDIDLIIEEAPQHGSYAAKDKPTEIFHIIEHFCLGKRRLHLFGRDSTLRPGWLTVGSELSASNFDPRLYASNFTRDPNGLLLGSTEEIERLRPKSPPPRHPNPTAVNVTTSNSTCPLTDPGSISAGSSLCLTTARTNNLIVPTSGSAGFPGRRIAPFGGIKSLIKPPCSQQSLLGLPSLIQSGSNRGGGSGGIRIPLNIQNNYLSPAASSSRNLVGLHSAATVTHQQSIRPTNCTPWEPSSNFALALVAAAAGSRHLGNAASLMSSTSTRGSSRTSLPDSPLISNLLSTGKLNPAVLALVNSATPNSLAGGLTLFNNILRGCNTTSSKHSQPQWR